MKHTKFFAVAISAASVATPAIAQDGDAPSGLHVRVNAGPSFPFDVQTGGEFQNVGPGLSLNGVSAQSGNTLAFESETDFGVGGAFGAGLGYALRLGDRWSFSPEIDFTARLLRLDEARLEIREIEAGSGAVLQEEIFRTEGGGNLGDLYFPGMRFTARYDFRNRLFGYAAVGSGYALDDGGNGDPFAGATAGAGYRLTERIDLTAEYRYTRVISRGTDLQFNDMVFGVGFKF